MRYYSRQYKKKVTFLIGKAKRNDLSLSFYLLLINRKSSLSEAIKIRKRDGEVLRYDLAKDHGLFRSIPIYSKKGISLGLNRVELINGIPKIDEET